MRFQLEAIYITEARYKRRRGNQRQVGQKKHTQLEKSIINGGVSREQNDLPSITHHSKHGPTTASTHVASATDC